MSANADAYQGFEQFENDKNQGDEGLIVMKVV